METNRLRIKYSVWTAAVAFILNLLFSPFAEDVVIIDGGVSAAEKLLLILRYVSTFAFIRFPGYILLIFLAFFALYNLKGLRKDINKLFYLGIIYVLVNVFQTTAVEKPLEEIGSRQGGALFLVSGILFIVIMVSFAVLFIKLDKEKGYIGAALITLGIVVLTAVTVISGGFVPLLIAKNLFMVSMTYCIWRISFLIFGCVMKEESEGFEVSKSEIIDASEPTDQNTLKDEEEAGKSIGNTNIDKSRWFFFARVFLVAFIIGFLVINSFVFGDYYHAERHDNYDDYIENTNDVKINNKRIFSQGDDSYIDIKLPADIEQISVFFYVAPGRENTKAYLVRGGETSEKDIAWNSTGQFITVDISGDNRSDAYDTFLRLNITDVYEIDYIYYADYVPAGFPYKCLLWAIWFVVSIGLAVACTFMAPVTKIVMWLEDHIFDFPKGLIEIIKQPKGSKLRYAFTTRQEIVYVMIIFILSSIYCYTEKTYFGYCTDDYNHYNRAAQVSYLLNGESDVTSYEVYVEHFYRSLTVDKEEELERHIAFYGDMHKLDYYSDANYYKGLVALPYIPSAIGLVIARGLGLSWQIGIIVGRWMMTWFFAAICYLSMKMLNDKRKLVVFLFSVVPTNIYFAANYNYDLWLTGFMMLAICIYVSEAYNLNKPVSVVSAVAMPLLIALGNVTKYVYFPMMFFVLFLSGKKFRNRVASILYRIYTIIMMIMPVIYYYFYIINNNGGGLGGGDSRGGSDVNATLQMQFFMEEPLKVLKILFGFLGDYLNPAVTGAEYTTYLVRNSMSYNASIVILIIILFAVCSNIDMLKYDNNSEAFPWWYRAGTIMEYAGIGFASAFSMYIIFTGLRYETVVGCPGRYLIPTLFPMLFVLTSFFMKKIKEIKIVIQENYIKMIVDKQYIFNVLAVVFLMTVNLDLMIFGVIL